MKTDRPRPARPWLAAGTGLLLAVTTLGTGAATAAATPAATSPVGPSLTFPGAVQDNPVPEALISAGADGFLHVPASGPQSSDYLWTTYGPSPTTTSLGALGAVRERSRTPAGTARAPTSSPPTSGPPRPRPRSP
ncbi:hypothetical protein GXW82_30355 [Streptacidiphilus sp. 4-A2]|nr:hypothetical protein [Streptacidiphilus sp. 4-A2]